MTKSKAKTTTEPDGPEATEPEVDEQAILAPPARPGANADIASSWGQWVHDTLNVVYPDVATAKLYYPNGVVPDGLRAYIVSEDATIIGKNGTWRYYTKAWPLRTGNTEQIVWSAASVAASSWSVSAVSGTAYTLEISSTLTTPSTALSAAVAQIQAGYFPSGVRHDGPCAPGWGSGAGSGRIQWSSTGAVVPTFAAADNTNAVTSVTASILMVLPDLIPA